MKLALAAAIIAVSALAACAGPTPGADSGGDPPSPGLVDIRGEWTLTGGTNDGVEIALSDFPVTMEFIGDNARVRTGCFSFDQPLAKGLDVQTIGVPTQSQAMCLGLTEEETAAIESIADVDYAEREGDVLTLVGDELELYFELVPAATRDDVVGTWSLDGIMWGDTATLVEDGPAITFAADGTVTGSTGCVEFSGTYDLVSGTNRIGELVLPEAACTDEGAMIQADVRAVLEDGFLVRAGAGTLSLLASAAETTLNYSGVS